ncbi:MAG TPA: FAD-dependent oxidoreductase, partial [Polyangia bacterium]|nr:FAD-dependent oxidoreductase [Polyangia bacterium]
MRVAVVGGGVAGLACALALRDRGHDPVVLERERAAGGKVRTERAGAWRVELGPSGVLDDAPATRALYARLGLDREVVIADDAARRRFVVQGGRLREVPDSPPKILFSSALTLAEKWRLLREPS